LEFSLFNLYDYLIRIKYQQLISTRRKISRQKQKGQKEQ